MKSQVNDHLRAFETKNQSSRFQEAHNSATKSISNPIPHVEKRAISDEDFHKQTVARLSNLVFFVAAFIFMAEIFLNWSR